MGLFKPGWMSKDENKALRTLDKVNDDETLFLIATECPHRRVQLEAVSRMKTEGARLSVASTRRHIDSEVRKAALSGASERGLCEIAKCGNGDIVLREIRLEAVRMMSDERMLAEVAACENSEHEQDAAPRAAAFAKVHDRELLIPLMDAYRDIYLGLVKRKPFGGSGDPIIRDAVADAYERIDRPPFEWTIIMQGDKAEENLLLDLGEMAYPADRDKLLLIAREKDGEPAAKATSMLPYVQERDALRELAAHGRDAARIATLQKMHLPEDHDVLAATFYDHAASKPVKLLAVRLLPEDDPILDKRCCPDCGTVGSVERSRWWSDYYESFQFEFACKACKRRGESVFECDEPVDFSVTLREFRGR